jgi:hypothetical protein
MALRDRAESAAAAGLLVVCLAFLASFGLGLRRGPGVDAPPEPAALHITLGERPVGRVEVLNASGRAGLARSVTAQLRDAGFDVVFYGNAAGFDGDSSVVIDRTGRDEVARAAGRHLGIGRIRTDRDTTLFLDATVVVGRDWVPAPAEAPALAGDGWWGRVGRWLRPTR